MADFEKYIVNPYDSGNAEWTHEELQRLSDYLWTLTDEIQSKMKDVETRLTALEAHHP